MVSQLVCKSVACEGLCGPQRPFRKHVEVSRKPWLPCMAGNDLLEADRVDRNPALSVILAARDEVGSVHESVMSILAQDYSGTLEVIEVNDCSTDRSGEILDELMTVQFGLIRQCPGNAFAPRNGQLVAVCANRPRFDFRQVGRLWQLAFEGHFFFARSSILVELLLGNDYGVVVSCLGCDVEPDSSLASAHTRERAGADPLISR